MCAACMSTAEYDCDRLYDDLARFNGGDWTDREAHGMVAFVCSSDKF